MKKTVKLQTSVLTTIIVIILLVVALSTATYAWFSANNVVNISDIQFYASSPSGEGDLAISWDETDRDTYVIAFAGVETKLKPMIPSNAPYLEQTYEDFTANFTTSTLTTIVKQDGTTEDYYKRDGSRTTPYTCMNETQTKREFFVTNLNSQFGLDVSISYDVAGALRDQLRIACFVEGKLIGIMSNTQNVYYGTIQKDTLVSSTPAITNLTYSSGDLMFHLDKSASKKICLVSWYDGIMTNDSHANGYSVLANLSFSGAYTE